FPAKARMVCRSWALQGYGAPVLIYVAYLLKVGLYVGGWVLACAQSPQLGGPTDIASWWLEPVAFQKAIAWSLMFEVLGLGCGSGPLTGRYLPPLGGPLYFLRPGTTRAPVCTTLPGLRGHTRTWLDAALYLGLLLALARALLTATPGLEHWLPIAVVLPLLGLRDRTVFLAARAEHYWVTVMCFVLAADGIAGAKAVQAALWLWAGISKLNHHFPYVVCVMTSNSPILRGEGLRRRMYRAYPDDLRPSRLAERMAHMGTALELLVPIVLLVGDGGPITVVGMVLMLALHGFITGNVPMGVPIEWNVMVVYGALFLFGTHAEVSLLEVGSVPLALLLLLTLVAVPLLGNLAPRYVSFLPSMRYYAGNWACSVWLFRGDSYRKLDTGLTKSTPWVYDQLDRFYDRRTSVGMVGKVIAFRLMHLHGRALPQLLPLAVDQPQDYEWVDGEIIAGAALGWNFGDGHLHDERLLAAIQAQCGFEPGQLRCIFVESQPLLGRSLRYRIHDASTGCLAQGQVDVSELRARPPWPEPEPDAATLVP
ncbi:MAG: DUF3556 domain-containing protein, partial [Nannocystaceae bacterium]